MMQNLIFDRMRVRSREHSPEKQKLTTQGSGKLHVSNLPINLSEQDVKDEFEK